MFSYFRAPWISTVQNSKNYPIFPKNPKFAFCVILKLFSVKSLQNQRFFSKSAKSKSSSNPKKSIVDRHKYRNIVFLSILTIFISNRSISAQTLRSPPPKFQKLNFEKSGIWIVKSPMLVAMCNNSTRCFCWRLEDARPPARCWTIIPHTRALYSARVASAHATAALLLLAGGLVVTQLLVELSEQQAPIYTVL